MNEMLRDLVGQKAKVWSQAGTQLYTDEGTLQGFDYPWLRLRKDDGEVLCFSIYHVRLLKPLARSGDDNHLLPVEPDRQGLDEGLAEPQTEY